MVQWVWKKLKRKLVPLRGKTFRNLMSFSIKCRADSCNWRRNQTPGTYDKTITSSPLWPETTWAFHYIRASHGILFVTIMPLLKIIPTCLQVVPLPASDSDRSPRAHKSNEQNQSGFEPHKFVLLVTDIGQRLSSFSIEPNQFVLS